MRDQYSLLLSTPSGKTVQVLINSDCCGRCDGVSDICQGDDPSVIKWEDLQESTVKEWGYIEKDLSELEDGLHFTPMECFTMHLADYCFEYGVQDLQKEDVRFIIINQNQST